MRERVPWTIVRVIGSSALVATLAGIGSARTDWGGVWQGGLRSDSDWYAARAEFREADGRVTGRLDVPALGVNDAAVEVRLEKETVHLVFELPELGQLEFVATLDDGALRSTGGTQWSAPAMQLVRSSPLPARDLDSCAGWYEIEPGAEILVTRGSEGGLRFFRGGSGGTLVPIARDRFLVAYDDTHPGPPRIDVRFVRDAAGAVEALEFDDGASASSALRVREHRIGVEPIALRNGALQLAGLLLSPRGKEPGPAVVFIGGTGYSTADRLYEMTLAERLLGQGIAVLLLDKRGCGASSGDWRTSSLADLASDALAAVGFLRQRKDVAPDAIGLWGVSEGGWVAPLAASKCPELAFIIDHGGPAVSPLEDELDDLTAGIQSAGFSGEDLEIAMTLARSLVEFYRSPEARPRFEAALASARLSPWWERFQAHIPQREDDWRVQWWRRRQFDSVATWKELRLPALVLIGAKDATMDRPKNLELYESFRASNPRLEIRVVPDADHGLRIDGEVPAGVIEGVADWLFGRPRR